MIVFISDMDTAKLDVKFFRSKQPLAQCAVSWKHWFICKRLRVVTYKSLKTKEKSSWVIPIVAAVAYGSCRLRELLITKFKSQFKWGFAKVVETRAGRLQEWSQGELRL